MIRWRSYDEHQRVDSMDGSYGCLDDGLMNSGSMKVG